ncbi:ABC transporter transmembrane domain-containing protein [Zunongwangia atlantica]|uniref:HlyB/MsbA family ABC transporter n=1 Tax=Zunongwangia atlantica 22II14-10F7 TaxID=1185767 RepID=A0A1Y1T336_9FLAO|nr:ABC transporter ATP-binding protein [Zunongwangia atlantica]ORL45436.1 HlyB/MsbA family ABC transporter [Zunongwangia atlantica 22II14-10F7]
MAKSSISPWTKLWNLLKLEKRDILHVLYYALFAGLISLTLPLGIQAIINLIQGAEVSTSWILLTCLVTLGVGFNGALQVLQLDLVENIQEKVFTRASFEFIYRFPKMRVRELENYYPPELSNRFFDVLTLQKGLQKLLLDFPAAVIQIVFGLLLLSFYHPFFIAFGILLVVLIYIIFKFSLSKAVNTSILESKKKYHIAFWIQQVAANFRTFKIFPDEYEQNKNNTLVQKYLEDRQAHFSTVKNQYKQMVVFKVIVTLGLLLIGGLLVLNQQMNIGQFVAAEIIIVLVINSVEKIGLSLETIYDVVTAVEKISEVTSKKLDRKTGVNENDVNIFPIKIEDLHIEKTVVPDLIVNQGNLINIVGAEIVVNDFFHYLSGMKKTKKGRIYFNREEIANVNLDNYRNKIALLLNTDSIFEGTIWENLTLSNPNMSSDRVYQMLEDFNVLDHVNKLPDSLNTYIFSGSTQIGAKTAKKICLIRALLKDPEFLMIEKGYILSENDQKALMKHIKRENTCVFLADDAHQLDEFEPLYLEQK